MISAAVARRRFVVISALSWLPAGLGMPAFVLLMQQRGLDVVTIGTVFAGYGLVARPGVVQRPSRSVVRRHGARNRY